MAQLTNKDRSLDSWLENQYSSEEETTILEESIELTSIKDLLGSFTPAYTPAAKATTPVKPMDNKQELDKVLAYAIGKVNKYRKVRSPNSLSKLRAAIKELNDVAKENGIEPLDEPEEETPETGLMTIDTPVNENVVPMQIGDGFEAILEAFNNAGQFAKEEFIRLLCEAESVRPLIHKYLK